MLKRPYVGITGAVTTGEVDFIVRAFNHAGYSLETEHIPMIGILVSSKTLANMSTTNRRYPNVSLLPEIFEHTQKNVFSMIHYNQSSNVTYGSLSEEIIFLFQDLYDRNLCRGLQLNIAWPKKEEVFEIKKVYPQLSIVLQLSSTALKDKSAKDIVDCIKEYEIALDYVLIDPSGGKGKEFDFETSCEIYEEIISSQFPVRVGFAGGFSGKNVAEKCKILSERLGTTSFCIDVEGGIRNKITEIYGDDLLDINKVKEYVDCAKKVLL